MGFDWAGKYEAVNYVVAYAPTCCTKDAELNRKLRARIGGPSQTDSSNALMDASALNGQRVMGCGGDENRVLRVY